MAFKLDISKSYDKLEWPFLEKMMRTLGFDEGWITWVMRCVTTVSYATLINGHQGPRIIPSKGLRITANHFNFIS